MFGHNLKSKEFEKKITAKNFEQFDQYHLVFSHDVLSQEKIRNMFVKLIHVLIQCTMEELISF